FGGHAHGEESAFVWWRRGIRGPSAGTDFHLVGFARLAVGLDPDPDVLVRVTPVRRMAAGPDAPLTRGVRRERPLGRCAPVRGREPAAAGTGGRHDAVGVLGVRLEVGDREVDVVAPATGAPRLGLRVAVSLRVRDLRRGWRCPLLRLLRALDDAADEALVVLDPGLDRRAL